MRTWYFSCLRVSGGFLTGSLACGLMNLSATSTVTPIGQSMPQKNRPRKTVRPRISIGTRTNGIARRALKPAPTKINGSIHRYASTGTAVVKGKAASHSSTTNKTKLIACIVRLKVIMPLSAALAGFAHPYAPDHVRVLDGYVPPAAAQSAGCTIRIFQPFWHPPPPCPLRR